MYESIFEQRYSRFRPSITNAQLFFCLGAFFGARKVFRNGSLIVLEDVHTEAFLLLHKGEQLRVLTDANQDEQRVQRSRREGVSGHTVHLAVRSLSAAHRNSGVVL